MMGDSHFAWIDIIARLAAALAAGALIGIDREWRHKTAGLRTHMLFALACAAMIVMAMDLYLMEFDKGPGSNPDATRIIQGIITGMSFLGAGAIIHREHRTQGLTTGAGVWLAGALGLIFGAGMYKLGAVTLAFGMVTLVFIRLVEPREVKKHREESERRAELNLPDAPPQP